MAYTIDDPLDQPVDVKPTKLDLYVAKRKGRDNPLVGLGDTIVIVGWMLKINPVYILAHAIHETGWGLSSIARDKKNLFGWNAIDDDPTTLESETYSSAIRFRNFDHCILRVMVKIRTKYFYPSKLNKYTCLNTLKLMNTIYAKDKNEPDDPLSWADKICKIMNSIEKFIQGGN